jgi:hypothetical protein
MSLLDPKWKYTHSTATNIRKTFARVRRELARQQDAPDKSPRVLRLDRLTGIERKAEEATT